MKFFLVCFVFLRAMSGPTLTDSIVVFTFCFPHFNLPQPSHSLLFFLGGGGEKEGFFFFFLFQSHSTGIIVQMLAVVASQFLFNGIAHDLQKGPLKFLGGRGVSNISIFFFLVPQTNMGTEMQYCKKEGPSDYTNIYYSVVKRDGCNGVCKAH